jgi:hypothetical protein
MIFDVLSETSSNVSRPLATRSGAAWCPTSPPWPRGRGVPGPDESRGPGRSQGRTPEYVEGKFCDVGLPLYGDLRSLPFALRCSRKPLLRRGHPQRCYLAGSLFSETATLNAAPLGISLLSLL